VSWLEEGHVDVVTAMMLALALVALAALAAVTTGGVPERRPPASPSTTRDFEIWPFF
jgi:hypothetical protein